MEASIGKALRDARLQKNLTLEEAAQVTEIHVDRLTELEQDDYSRFPSLSYARNFLILYAKFLEVDVTRYQVLDIGKPVFSSNYQYMQGDLGTIRWTGPRRKPVRRKRGLLALGILVAAISIGALTAFIIIDVLRLPIFEANSKEESSEAPATSLSPSPSPASTPAEKPKSKEESAVPAVEAAPTQDPATETGDEALLANEAAVAGVPDPSMETPTAEGETTAPSTDLPEEATPPGPAESSVAAEAPAAAVAAAAPSPVPTPAPSPSPTPAVDQPEREIKVFAAKRTRVKITRDVHGSTPIYDGWLQAGKSYTFRGKQFWIESRDPASLKVTSDGKPAETPVRSGTTNRSL